MAGLAVVELLDGSWLGLDVQGADWSVDRELALWAIVPEEAGDTTPRSDMRWDEVLAAGPLLVTLSSRGLNEAAWGAFPSTARHLSGWWDSSHPALSSDGVADRVAQVTASAWESPEELVVEWADPVLGADGVWSVQAREGVTARCDADGLLTRVWLGGSAGRAPTTARTAHRGPRPRALRYPARDPRRHGARWCVQCRTRTAPPGEPRAGLPRGWCRRTAGRRRRERSTGPADHW